VRLLVDSAALIWWFAGDAHLGPDATAAIEDPGTEAYASVASVWEIGIKQARGKLALDVPVPEIMEAGLINALPIEMAHAMVAADLPRHHADPFDRMLVAQAQVEGLVLLTPDAWHPWWL
jgi:PIN domain nuclease of toxin-antitoxin system